MRLCYLKVKEWRREFLFFSTFSLSINLLVMLMVLMNQVRAMDSTPCFGHASHRPILASSLNVVRKVCQGLDSSSGLSSDLPTDLGLNHSLDHSIDFPLDFSLDVNELTQGTPLPQAYQNILMHHQKIPLSLSGLNFVYRNILKEGRGEVELIEVKDHQFSFKVHFLDAEGKKVGEVKFELAQKGEALQLNLDHIQTLPTFRGQRIIPEILKASISLLRHLNSDPGTKIILDATTGVGFYGAYLWAPFGFHYTLERDHSRMKREFQDWIEKYYGPRRDVHHPDLLKAWDRYPQMRDDQLSQEELDKIFQRTQDWKQPWEMALYNSQEDLQRKFGLYQGKLGKEFMGFQMHILNWHGFLPVNDLNNAGLRQFQHYYHEVMIRERKEGLSKCLRF